MLIYLNSESCVTLISSMSNIVMAVIISGAYWSILLYRTKDITQSSTECVHQNYIIAMCCLRLSHTQFLTKKKNLFAVIYIFSLWVLCPANTKCHTCSCYYLLHFIMEKNCLLSSVTSNHVLLHKDRTCSSGSHVHVAYGLKKKKKKILFWDQL